MIVAELNKVWNLVSGTGKEKLMNAIDYVIGEINASILFTSKNRYEQLKRDGYADLDISTKVEQQFNGLIDELQEVIRSSAKECEIQLQEGVYVQLTGPNYETPAEIRMVRSWGADAVGMSTIPEVIVARHSSIPVFGMSVITNEAHDDYAEDYVNDGDDVVKAADAAADKMTLLFTRLISQLG
jgi:purine nucleoside phosphorylase